MINQLSTHIWTITYDNSVSRSSFVLTFPSCVTISNATTVSMASNTVSVTAFNSTSINFTLSTSVTALSYTFSVQNVKNCFYSGSFRNYFVYNNADNINESPTSMTSVIYNPGTINNCQLLFDGYTGDIGSTVDIRFGIKNNVTGNNLTFRFDYRTYSSSSYSITAYSSVASCSLFVGTTQVYGTVSAFINSV